MSSSTLSYFLFVCFKGTTVVGSFKQHQLQCFSIIKLFDLTKLSNRKRLLSGIQSKAVLL